MNNDSPNPSGGKQFETDERTSESQMKQFSNMADQTAKQGYKPPFKVFKTDDLDFKNNQTINTNITRPKKEPNGPFYPAEPDNQKAKNQFGANFAPTFTQQFQNLQAQTAQNTSQRGRKESDQQSDQSQLFQVSPKAKQFSYLPSIRHNSQVLKESQLKVLQLEHDLKLKEMKLQIQEMQSNTQMDEFKNSIMQLEINVSKLAKDKIELVQSRDGQVRKAKIEVKSLEQELIDAKMESALLKSRLQEQQNKVSKLRKQKTKADKDQKDLQEKFKFKELPKEETKENENDTKVPEQDAIVNPMDKFKNNRDSLSYVDQIQKIEEKRKTKLNIKAMKIEELKKVTPIEELDMDNEDWNETTDKKKEVIKEVSSESDNEESTKDMYQQSKEQTFKFVRKAYPMSKSKNKELIKKWKDIYIPIIKLQMIGMTTTLGMFQADSSNKGMSSKQVNQIEAAIHVGIPRELRTQVWQMLVPNNLKITEKLYKVLIDRVRLCQENADKDTQFRKHQKVIEEDLHRTYSEMKIFRFGERLYQPLKNVLLAFSLLRPDLGYVQGMSYVAGSILLHYGSELETFTMFANIMNREEMLFTFYSFDMDKVNIIFHVFMRLMKEKIPKLHDVFVETGISCSIFLFEWVVAVYSNIFQLDLTSRMWDSFFYYGDFFIIKSALAICLSLESQSNMLSFENIVLQLKNVKQFIKEAEIFKALNDIKITKAQFLKIKKQTESQADTLERLT